MSIFNTRRTPTEAEPTSLPPSSYPSAPQSDNVFGGGGLLTADDFSLSQSAAANPSVEYGSPAPAPQAPATTVGEYGFDSSQPGGYDPAAANVSQASQPAQQVSTPGSTYEGYEATGRLAPFDGAEYNPYQTEDIAAGTGGYDYQRGEVDPQSLVENRLTGLLKSDSEYMQLAETGAKQQAASSGLLNTSIAAGAGRKAAIDASLPIAQQDAATYGEMTQANLGYATEADRVNAERALAVESQNIAAANEAARTSALAQSEVSQFNVGTREAADQFYAAQQTETDRANAMAMLDASQFNAGIISQEAQFNETQRAQIDQFNKSALNDAATNYANAKNDQNFEILKGSVSAQLANIDAKLQEDLLNIEQTWLSGRDMQSINGAIYQEMIQGIGSIIANSTADPVTGLPKEIEAYMSSIGATYDFVGDTATGDIQNPASTYVAPETTAPTEARTPESTPKPTSWGNYVWDNTANNWVRESGD